MEKPHLSLHTCPPHPCSWGLHAWNCDFRWRRAVTAKLQPGLTNTAQTLSFLKYSHFIQMSPTGKNHSEAKEMGDGFPGPDRMEGTECRGRTGGKYPAWDSLNNKQTLSKIVKNWWNQMNSNRVSSGLYKPCLMSAEEAEKGPDSRFSLWAPQALWEYGRGWRRNVGRGIPGRFWDPAPPKPGDSIQDQR